MRKKNPIKSNWNMGMPTRSIPFKVPIAEAKAEMTDATETQTLPVEASLAPLPAETVGRAIISHVSSTIEQVDVAGERL